MNSYQEKKYSLSGSAGQIELMFCEAPSAKAVAIMCHPHSQMGGSMDNKVVTTVTRAWRQLGYHTLRFNFRSVGQSSGIFDEGRGEQDDLAAVIQWGLTECSDLPVIIGGFSFGAYVALSFCQNYTPNALLLVAPPVQYQAFETLHLPQTKAYLVVAEKDDVVSTSDSLAWAESEPFLKVLNVPGATHFFHGKLLQIKDFVLQNMSPSVL